MNFYNSTKPTNYKASYSDYDNLNFVINYGEDLSLISGTVRLNFDLTLNWNANRAGTLYQILPTDNVFIDALTGAHAVVSSVSTSMRSGQLENLQNYNKFVSMKHNVSLTKNSAFQSDKVCELVNHDNNIQRFNLHRQIQSNNNVDNMSNVMPVSLKLHTVLNNMEDTETGGMALLSGKNGEIMVQIQLERAVALFTGPAAAAGCTYTISNPSITYQTTNAAPSKGVLMRVKESLKQTINSNNFNLSANAPYVVEGVSGTVIRTADEFQATQNHFQCAALKGVQKLRFVYNDSQNRLINYELDSVPQILEHYLDSHPYDTSLNVSDFANNQDETGFGVGISFKEAPVDLRKNTLSVNLIRDPAQNEQYSLYLFFHGLATM